MYRPRKSVAKARYEPGPEYDASLPYGGRVVLAKKKKPESWLAIAMQVVAVTFASWLIYFSYFHMATLQFYIAWFYAQLGYGHAQHLVGQKFLQGYGVDADQEQAMFWLKKASEQGHPHASYNLAIAHLRGMHNHIHKTEAHKLIHHAATNGVPEAQKVLEHICSQGECA